MYKKLDSFEKTPGVGPVESACQHASTATESARQHWRVLELARTHRCRIDARCLLSLVGLLALHRALRMEVREG